MLHFGSSAVTAETMKTIRISALTRSAISRLYVEPVANQPDVFDVFLKFIPAPVTAGRWVLFLGARDVGLSIYGSVRKKGPTKTKLLLNVPSIACCMSEVESSRWRGEGRKDAEIVFRLYLRGT